MRKNMRYPQVAVRLFGEDGNANAIVGRCEAAARRAGLTKQQIQEFTADATAGSYADLLWTCTEYFDCDAGGTKDEEE